MIGRLCMAGLLIAAISAAPSPAQTWSYTRIADSSTAIPGTSANFTGFGLPSIDAGRVAFAGFGARSGIYTGSGGALGVVADTTTPVPQGPGAFTGFGSIDRVTPSISGDNVSFAAQYGPSLVPTGVYFRGASGLERVVDHTIAMPNSTASFFWFSPPDVDGERVVFQSSSFGNTNSGVYSWQSGSLSVLADRSTALPGAPGPLADFTDCALDEGRVAFTARATGFYGIYRAETNSQITRLYDSNTVVPGGNGGTFAAMGGVQLDAGAVAFYAFGADQEGVYSDASGSLAVIADHNTPIPGRPGTFTGFGHVAIDDGVVAFTGVFGGNRGVYSTHLGSLGKVLAQGDLLDGRIVRDTLIGPQGLSGDSLALYVEFTNGTYGIYRATIPAPGVWMVLAGAASIAGGSRRRRP